MSNRTIEQIYSKNYKSSQQENSDKSGRRISGSRNQRSNGFRLSDIAKLIKGRHGGPCYDPDWCRIYFFAALPHVLAASAGLYEQAVRAWAIQWIPVFWIVQGDEWFADQIETHLDKPRRFMRIDKLNRMLKIEDHEWKEFRLCALSAVSRPSKVRAKERKARGAERDRNRRAARGATPRSESLMQRKPWKDEGKTRTVWYAERKAAADLKKEMAKVLDDFARTDNAPPDGLARNIYADDLGQIRAQHHYYTSVALPTKEQQAQTLAALIDGASAALDELMAIDPVFGRHAA